MSRRALRALARNALARYDLDVARLRLISGETNTLFRVDAADGRKVALRITSPRVRHGLDEIRSEMAWLRALRRDTDLEVPEPVAATDGSFVTEMSADGLPEARPVVVFRWIAGRDLGDDLTEETADRFGELTARLHGCAREFVPPAGFRVRRLDRVFPYSDPDFPVEPIVLFDDRHRPLFPSARRRVYERAVDRVRTTLERLYSAAEPPRVVHGDLHPGNVKIHRDTLRILDFEDVMWGYPVQDVATALYYIQLLDEGSKLRDAFRAGYSRCEEWPERVPGEIEVLRAWRALQLVNWVLASDAPRDRDLAPAYVVRIEKRLRALLDL